MSVKTKSTVLLTLKFDAGQLIEDVMSSFPEYSSPSLTCIDFDYERGRYEFWDNESTPDNLNKSVVKATIKDVELSRSGLVKDAVVYELNRSDLTAGMQILLDLVLAGELPGLGLAAGFQEAGNWDADCADALVQCAIFGEVIYG